MFELPIDPELRRDIIDARLAAAVTALEEVSHSLAAARIHLAALEVGGKRLFYDRALHLTAELELLQSLIRVVCSTQPGEITLRGPVNGADLELVVGGEDDKRGG